MMRMNYDPMMMIIMTMTMTAMRIMELLKSHCPFYSFVNHNCVKSEKTLWNEQEATRVARLTMLRSDSVGV